MRAVLFVDRSVLYFGGGGTKTPISISLSPQIIRDMELIDEEALQKLITDLVKTKALKPASLLICVSNASYFSKDIAKETDQAGVDKIKKEFDESIPFNKVLSNVFTQGGKSKVIGINRDLVYALKRAFEQHGFQTELIIPIFALYGDQAVTFSEAVGSELLKHFNSLEQVSFSVVTDDSSIMEKEDKEFAVTQKKPQNRVTLLIGIFIFLILILILVLVYMLSQRNKKQAIQAPLVSPTPVTTAPVTPISPTLAATIVSEIPKDQLVIYVLNGSGTPGEADRIKERLSEAEFTNVITSNAPTQVSEKTSLVFKNTVSRTYRDEIGTMIKSLGFDISVRENSEIEYDVLITTFQKP